MLTFDKPAAPNGMMKKFELMDEYVLIVDDQPVNIRVLGNTLKAEFQVRFAKSGREALDMVRSGAPPELILLDIMMPDMDGYQVCDELKKDKQTRHIPVIFVTARDHVADQYRGFALGAVDYVTKPFNSEIVAARVRAHVALKRYRDQLENHISDINMKMLVQQQELDQRRDETRLMEELLAHAQRTGTLGAMVSEISHEIKNPANHVMLSANALQGMWDKVRPVIEQYIDEEDAELFFNQPAETFYRAISKSFDQIAGGVLRIKNIVEELKQYYRRADGFEVHEYIDVNKVIESALTLLHPKIRESTGNLQISYGETPYVKCSYQQLEQVIINLLQNAYQALGDFHKAIRIRSEYRKKDDMVVITIEDEGVGISEENLSKIFDPYFTTKADAGGSGMGLMVSNRLIQKNGGKLSFTSESGKGTAAAISLPAFWSGSGD